MKSKTPYLGGSAEDIPGIKSDLLALVPSLMNKLHSSLAETEQEAPVQTSQASVV